MKYNAKPLRNKPGHFAVFTGKQYFVDTVTTDEKAAKVRALHMSGQWYNEQIQKVDSELEKLGAFDDRDPHGYLA